MKNIQILYQRFVLKGILPLRFTGLVLICVGLFLIIQSLFGELLPHDLKNLGMSNAQLAFFNNGKILKFMFHDRIAFGGSLISLGILYNWLVLYPLKNGKGWAWWLFLISGISGFGSFLTYIGYGYLDVWHFVGTLLLLPVYLLGLYYSYAEIKDNKNISCLFKKNGRLQIKNTYGVGYIFLLLTAFGLALGGMVIMFVGMTLVFVPQDLDYMHINVCGLTQINSRLIPIIAHDRASFGGGLATTGILFFFSIWHSNIDEKLWRTLAVSISIGFLVAIGVHFWISYLDFSHLFPAYLGLIIFYSGLLFTYNKRETKMA